MKTLLISTLLLSLCLCAVLTVAADKFSISVIPLKHRPADRLVDSLAPMVAKGGTLTAAGNQLIIKTDPDNLIELQALIDELDQPYVQLMISVRSNKQLQDKTLHAGIQSSIRTKHIQLGTQTKKSNQPVQSTNKIIKHQGGVTSKITTNNRVIVRHSTGQAQQGQVYSVQVLESHSAFIETGETIPVVTAYSESRYHQYTEREYHDVTSGFYVTPTLFGERVSLAISIKDHQRQGDNISTQDIQTTLSGRLGEWIALGAIEQHSNDKDTDLSHYHTTKKVEGSGLYLKVDRIN